MTFVRTVLGDIDAGGAGRDLRPRASRHRGQPDHGAVPRLPPRRCRPGRGGAGPGPGAGAALGGRRHARRHRPRCASCWPRSAGGAASTSSRPRVRITGATTRSATGPWPWRWMRSRACSWPTSTTASMRWTTARPSCTGRRIGRVSSRSPARRVVRRRGTRGSSQAAAMAQRATGCPILTHCEEGHGGAGADRGARRRGR